MRGRFDGEIADGGPGSLLGTPDIFRWPEERLGGLLNFRWIPEKPDHGQIFLTFRYEIIESLSVGADYRPLTGDVTFAGNWRAISENDGWRPAVILGTSNDDFGDVSSQSYYGTVSKHLGEWGGFSFSPYAGATYIEALNDLRPVGGLHVRRGDWSAMISYSGVDEHLTVSRDIGNHTVSFVLFDLEKPGLAWTWRF